MPLTLGGSLLGRHDGRFMFQLGAGVFAISDQTHQMLAHIDRERPASEKFGRLCDEFGLDERDVADSRIIVDVRDSAPLDEQVFRIVGTGTVVDSGCGIRSIDGDTLTLPSPLIALWAIASRKPNIAEAVATASQIAGCSPRLISDEFKSVAPRLVAGRLIDVGLAIRHSVGGEDACANQAQTEETS